MPPEQAEAIATSQQEAFSQALDKQVATKADIIKLEAKIDLTRSELREEITEIRGTLRLHAWMLAVILAAVVFPLLQQLLQQTP